MKKLTMALILALVIALGAFGFAACDNTDPGIEPGPGPTNNYPFDQTKAIAAVAREDGSGTRSAFMDIINGNSSSWTEVAGVLAYNSTEGVMEAVRTNGQAIGYDSMGFVTSAVKKLKVDGVEATVANAKDGSYKLSRELSIIFKTDGNYGMSTVNAAEKAACDDFKIFLESSQAQKIISDEGYIAIKDGAPTYTAPSTALAAATIKISGSTSLRPLMLELTKAYESFNKAVAIAVGAGGSGTGRTNAGNGTSHIGMISSAFGSAEEALNLEHMVVSKDGIAVIVNNNNTLDNITIAELKNIYLKTGSSSFTGAPYANWKAMLDARA